MRYKAAFTRDRIHLEPYEIGKDKPCVYTRPGGSGKDRICYQVPNGSIYEGELIWNCTVPVSNRSRVNRVDASNGSEHIGPRVKTTFHSTIFDIPMRPVRDDQRHRRRFTR